MHKFFDTFRSSTLCLYNTLIAFSLFLTILTGFVTGLLAANTPAAISTTSLLPVKDPNALIGNELSRLNHLIQATQKSLEGQKQLREKIIEYQKIQESYLLHPKDNEILFRMIKSAYGTLQSIQDNHLEHAFDPDFMSELKVLAQVASKRGVPKP